MAADYLTATVFRALYKDYRLFSFDGNYIVIPAGTLFLREDELPQR
jgi:hypothetical protein